MPTTNDRANELAFLRKSRDSAEWAKAYWVKEVARIDEAISTLTTEENSAAQA